MRMMSIASGSSGNCIYIGTERTHLLVDAGVPKKRVLEGLARLDLSLNDIDAILITHEHSDHINGVGVLERALEIPLYGTKKTLGHIERATTLGRIPEGIYRTFKAGDSFEIGDITVGSIPVSHDAKDPVGYRFDAEGKRIGVVTDLGVYTDATISFYSNMDAALIEANHDVNMLLNGPYPYALKQRILGVKGHLSNEDSGRLIGSLLNDRIKRIYLGHLSKENNFPELAYQTVRMEVNLGDNPYRADDFDIRVARRDEASEILNL